MWYMREFFPRSRPRQARGGIKAQSQRGAIGQTWWARRWIEVLESFEIGGRLSRGRSYARQGQVLSIDVTAGKVKARVQGSQPRPYSVTMQIKALSSADWKKVTGELGRQALFAAKLLAGEMPAELERVFAKVKVSLFPQRQRDLATECSCPDWSNPCKHVAAVYYLLAEEFDRDPFLLFKLRGLEREELVRQLSTGRAVKAVRPAAAKPAKEAVPASEPLPADAVAFWSAPALPADFFGDVQTPPVAAALPRRLGSFPFWRGAEPFLEAMEPVYRAASSRGMAVFAGDRPAGW